MQFFKLMMKTFVITQNMCKTVDSYFPSISVQFCEFHVINTYLYKIQNNHPSHAAVPSQYIPVPVTFSSHLDLYEVVLGKYVNKEVEEHGSMTLMSMIY